MQRDRDDHVRVEQELRPGTGHHGAERPRQLDAVAVFEPVHEPARGLVVTGDGAGAPEHGRIGDGGRRQQRDPEIDLERRAEALAERPLDEAHLAPAARAQGVRLAGRRRAGDAGRRIDDAEPETRRRTGEGGEGRAHH